jgi:hypothetical protein
MKLRISIILLYIITVVFVSCISSQYQRSPSPGFGFERIGKKKKVDANEKAFDRAILFGTIEEIEIFLKSGHDPDHTLGDDPWFTTNPLYSLARDYEKAELFIRYGANVTKRPYLARVLHTRIISERFPDAMLLDDPGAPLEKEIYDLAKLFLDAGADPNLKGGSAPVLFIATDWNYRRYFKKHGRLPINVPIKYSAFSIVDLLLEYGAVLDEESLEYAKESTAFIGNSEMEDYIKEIWERQQANKKK